MHARFPTLLFLSTLVGACTTAIVETDDAPTAAAASAARNDAARAGLEAGTAIAEAVVAVANDRSLASVDYVAIGLARKAADTLVARRDATPFRTLAELETVPGIGVRSLEKLRAYAEANRDRYVRTPIASACSAAAPTRAMLERLFAGGVSAKTAAQTSIAVFTRPINALGLTGPWTEAPPLSRNYQVLQSGHSIGSGTTHFDQALATAILSPSGTLGTLQIQSTGPKSGLAYVGRGFEPMACAVDAAGFVTCPTLRSVKVGTAVVRGCSANCVSYTFDEHLVDGQPLVFRGVVGDGCFRLEATVPEAQRQTAVVIQGTF
jgi:hypothetical protein